MGKPFVFQAVDQPVIHDEIHASEAIAVQEAIPPVDVHALGHRTEPVSGINYETWGLPESAQLEIQVQT